MIKKILFLFFVVFAVTAYSQDVTITGTVTDANSEPLVGVNVLVKGTTTGAITVFDGNFSVSGKKGSTLVFSYIGMLTQEVVYKGTALRVVMKDDSKALEEVVVIGYQTVKKSDLTGAVAVVDTKEMKKSAAGTLVSQMQGLATGINVRSSGRAGEDASIEIRGVGSLSNNSPLWVIDGMITDPGVDFNPADAESIQILKDASAAAIYGSRAANGVIIVTTKKGTKGPMKVNVSVKETLEWSPKFDLMNAAEYIKYNDIAYNEAIKDGIATVNSTQKHSQYDTNWQDEVLFPHEAASINICYLNQAVQALEDGEIEEALKALYEVDNNCYAFLFDEEVYYHFTEYILHQPKDRLMWGAGRILHHENLYGLVQRLKELDQMAIPGSLDVEIRRLEAAIRRQQAYLKDDLHYMKQSVDKIQALINDCLETSSHYNKEKNGENQ